LAHRRINVLFTIISASIITITTTIVITIVIAIVITFIIITIIIIIIIVVSMHHHLGRGRRPPFGRSQRRLAAFFAKSKEP
jgi:hypothetical protein